MTTTVSDTLNSYERRMQERVGLDIELLPRDDRVKIRQKRFAIGYTDVDVQDYNAQFIEILEEVRKDVTQLGRNVNQFLPNGMKYLKALRDVGAGAYALVRELAEYIQTQEQDEEERGISLDFTFPVPMAFLWEMMYSGSTVEDPEFEKFWGFRYPIGHLQWDADVKRLVKLRKGILASAHDQLLYSKEELEHLEQELRELGERCHLDVDLRRLEKEIPAGMASHEELMKFFTGEGFNYGVVHFACHCENPSVHVSRAYLSFTVHQEVQMSLGQFNTEVSANKRRFRYQPLVFLNACESGTPLHLQSLNFPLALINFGASGVIATACTIPDNFASAFATKFYRCLFNQCQADSSDDNALPLMASDMPHYICEALWKTRRYFWEMYKNPLGLAYGLYAESNQELKLS